IEEYTKEYGTDHLYMSDTFIEMKPTFPAETRLQNYAEMGEGVYKAIAAADPDGVWIMMGWPFLVLPDYWGEEEIEAMFSKVPQEKAILLDLAVESTPIWKRSKAFRERQWISSVIHNYGENTMTYGILPTVADVHQKVLADPDHGNHVGAGITPEGIEQNSVVYELQTDAIWSKKPIDLAEWLPAYCRQRYGACPPAMEQAWKILSTESVYGADMDFSAGEQDLYAAKPCIAKHPGLDYRPSGLAELQPEPLLKAVDLFISCSDELGGSDLYRRDLVDLVKQYVVLNDRLLVPQIKAAHEAGDTAKRDSLIEQFMQLIGDLDRLLGTRPEYRLSHWINDARAKATTPEEADLYEHNARQIITRWGGNLTDYAFKEWSGLLNGYYGIRWRMFFDRLQNDKAFDAADVKANIEAWEMSWINSTAPVKENTGGDEIAIARELLERYRKQALSKTPVPTKEQK
ncbi:MAG: alpha-N-acetylglucosaminidase C-terminal domain-containing protein, partial [Verrucomicrobiota bacterium]